MLTSRVDIKNNNYLISKVARYLTSHFRAKLILNPEKYLISKLENNQISHFWEKLISIHFLLPISNPENVLISKLEQC